MTPTAAGSFMYSILCSGGGYSEGVAGSTTLTVNPTVGFTQTILVSKFAGTAALTTDAKLVNPKGIAIGPGGRVWVAIRSTGIVVNTTPDFVITANGQSVPAERIYAGKGGMSAGGSPIIDSADAAMVHADTDAAYTGLALANNGNGNFLYATDFLRGRVDVFDANFAKQTASSTSFAFGDPTLPAGYAPFGIQAVERAPGGRTQIYVTYARQGRPDGLDPAIGAGLGIVNVFDTHGRLLRRLVSAGGALNAPWGMALAPADFGSLGNALLVGNAGDGTIDAYDPTNGRLIGTVTDADGRAIVTHGLWGIAFGNGASNQPRNALFFAASTDGVDGVYGRIDPGVAALTLD